MNRRGFFGWLAAVVAGLFGVRSVPAIGQHPCVFVDPFARVLVSRWQTVIYLMMPNGAIVRQTRERFVLQPGVDPEVKIDLPELLPGFKRTLVNEESPLYGGRNRYRLIEDEYIQDPRSPLS